VNLGPAVRVGERARWLSTAGGAKVTISPMLAELCVAAIIAPTDKAAVASRRRLASEGRSRVVIRVVHGSLLPTPSPGAVATAINRRSRWRCSIESGEMPSAVQGCAWRLEHADLSRLRLAHDESGRPGKAVTSSIGVKHMFRRPRCERLQRQVVE
jgi:hypothetical protein